jgi:serine O-acetyltransferase
MNPLLFLVVLFRNPGMHFSVLYRWERYFLTHTFLPFKLFGAILYPGYFIYTYYILDIDISPRVSIGKGLYIHNKGVIFTDKVIIGDNLTIIAPTTFGTKAFINYPKKGMKVGNDVIVYAGSRIIGEVNIGDNVAVAANAVVIKNVPANCVVGGVPAKILKHQSRRPNIR